MGLYVILSLASPFTWLMAMMIVVTLMRWRDRVLSEPGRRRNSTSRRAAEAVAGAAFQFFLTAYRPNHSFIRKAQIEQEEDADEDDDGSPETPLKHLHRQLRRVRRGEPIDRLIWRLE